MCGCDSPTVLACMQEGSVGRQMYTVQEVLGGFVW